MSEQRPIGVGIIGLGFMGRTHLNAYAAAAKAGIANELVAVCDASEERREGIAGGAGNLETGQEPERMFDPATLNAYSTAAELLADPKVDLVSICTPTDSHVDLAIEALALGKHVLVEKPVATASRDVERLVKAAEVSKQLCMPAHCMRFWPGWDWLKAAIDSGEYGAVRSAVFRRLASPPAWSKDFYLDSERTGGALVDLHIHDADFIRWCFGDPQDVSSAGSLDHLTTIYRYKNGPSHVVAEGGWDHTPGFDFQMRYTVVFEEATAEFNLARDPQLLLSRDGESTPVELPGGDGYEGEVRHLLERIHAGGGDALVTVEDALAVARLLEQERAGLSG